MYSKEFKDSLALVERAREKNISAEPLRMTADEKTALLNSFHPDYKDSEFQILEIGANKGEKVPKELADILQAHSRVIPENLDLENPDFETDVLIIGGGGAGAAAAIEANEAGAEVMIVTKLRLGDSNTGMAEGGIQAADKKEDSPALHFIDSFGGGHFAAKRELLSKLVCDAPEAIDWLSKLGVEFDKETDGTMITTHGGGTSRRRMHASKDYTGAEIMRTLRDEVLSRDITSTWTGGGNGIANLHDHGFWRSRLDVVMVGGNSMDDFVTHAIFFGKLSTNIGVLSFDFVGDSLTDIVH